MRTCLFVLALFAVPAQARTLPPTNQCTADKSFLEFHQRFATIVKNRDSAALIDITAPDIQWSFGGDVGRVSFVDNWQLQSGAASKIWAELDALLTMGCAPFSDGVMALPRLYGADAPADWDVFEYYLVNAKDVNLRSAPSLKAKVVARLSWELVTILPRPPKTVDVIGWTYVTTEDGRSGYVADKFLRSPIGYRALFEQRNGKWMMTDFVNGD